MTGPAGRRACRVAAVDCGTNAARLLIADVDGGTLADVDRRMEVVRLGEGVDRTGRIRPDALRRTLVVLEHYAELCRVAGVQRLLMVATSATRDAANRAEFVDGVRRVLGVTPEVISGDEEARLSFSGALAGLTARRPAPYLVVDLGGGSTEFVLGTAGPEAVRSVDVGCVRLTERHLAADPPTPAQVAAAEADVRAALDHAASVVRFDRAATLIGLAGTVTTVTAHALGLDRYDPAAVHGALLAVPAVLDACEDLLGMTRERRAALPYMHPGRVDVIGGGALVWGEVVRRVTAAAGITEVLTSEHDILDGLALEAGRVT